MHRTLRAPTTYADEMRTALGLTPYRRSRRPPLTTTAAHAAAAAAVVVVAVVARRATRPEPLPEGFTALQSDTTAVMREDDEGVAGALQIVVGASDGDARIAVVLANTSDHPIDVDSIGPPMVRWDGGGSVAIGGVADVPRRRLPDQRRGPRCGVQPGPHADRRGGFGITVHYRIGDACFSHGVAGVGLDAPRCAVN